MKKCQKCLIEKDDSEFYKRNAKKTQSYCKPCFSAYCIERWIDRKLEAIRYKGGSCAKCGYNKNYAALQFHHRDQSTKEVEWIKLRLRNWKAILLELDKCDLLCSNCHAEVHNPEAKLEGIDQ